MTGLRGGLGPYFGDFGGRFVPESLIAALDELDVAYTAAKTDPVFQAELAGLHATYTGRPCILTEVPRFAEHAGGARVVLKREDLNHTGSHKINNVLGQALLARRLGKTRLIAETGAGQHGVATATAAALFGMECVVYMGEVDTERQALNVARMRLLGAEVVAVTTGSRTLKDAINDALRDWVANVDTTHYVLRHRRRPASRSRSWCATSTRSSARRRVRRCSSSPVDFPTRSRRASAAEATPSASSTPSSTTRPWPSTATRRRARDTSPTVTRRP